MDGQFGPLIIGTGIPSSNTNQKCSITARSGSKQQNTVASTSTQSITSTITTRHGFDGFSILSTFLCIEFMFILRRKHS